MTLFILIFWILSLEAILLLCIGMMFWKTKSSSYGQDVYFPRYQFSSEENSGEPVSEMHPVETLFDNTHERLDGLTADVKKLTREVSILKRAVVDPHPARPLSDDRTEIVFSLQQKLDELAESVSSVEKRLGETRELELLFKLEKKLEQRMAKLERALDSMVKRVSDGDQQNLASDQNASVTEQIGILREELTNAASEEYQRLQDSLFGLIAEAIARLRSEMLEISGNLKGKDTERSADNQRIMQGLTAEPPAVLDEVSLGPEERSNRPPRILSRAARERYQDIVDLWDAGVSVRSIALQTGVGPDEVELIIAGLKNGPAAPEREETS